MGRARQRPGRANGGYGESLTVCPYDSRAFFIRDFTPSLISVLHLLRQLALGLLVVECPAISAPLDTFFFVSSSYLSMLSAIPQDTLSPPLLLKCAMRSLFIGCSCSAGAERPLKTLLPYRISSNSTSAVSPSAITTRPGSTCRERRASDEISLTLERPSRLV